MDVNQQLAMQQQQAGTTPSYLRQTNNPTVPGAVANMIKAIMAGNDDYKQQHAQASVPQQQFLPTGSSVPGAQGATSVGGPSGPAPLNYGSPNPVSGTPPMTGAAPTSATGVDPVTAALMSPVPGMDNGAGFKAPNPLAVGGAWG